MDGMHMAGFGWLAIAVWTGVWLVALIAIAWVMSAIAHAEHSDL